MLVSEIKSKFKTYSDTMSFNFSNTQLNAIFAKASINYFESLANNWGKTLQNSTDIATISRIKTLTPTSNVILFTDIDADFNRIGFIRPSYTVNGVNYAYPAKQLLENLKYSTLSEGSYSYPKYYFIDTGIILEPSTTPTSFFCTYLVNPPTIDFSIADYDVAISPENEQGIIEQAMVIVTTAQREGDEQGVIINGSQFSKI